MNLVTSYQKCNEVCNTNFYLWRTGVTVSFVLTYDSLTSTVLQYLERSDQAVVEAIPTFITLAEFEIAQQINTYC